MPAAVTRFALALALFVSAAGVWHQAFLGWNERVTFDYVVRNHALKTLLKVRAIQDTCRVRRGRYCTDVGELLATWEERQGAESPPEVRQLLAQPETWPGLLRDGGTRDWSYFISLRHGDAAGWLAEARYMGPEAFGEDVWTLGPTGDPQHEVISPRYAEGASPSGLLGLGLLLAGAWSLAQGWRRLRAAREAS